MFLKGICKDISLSKTSNLRSHIRLKVNHSNAMQPRRKERSSAQCAAAGLSHEMSHAYNGVPEQDEFSKAYRNA